MRTSFCARSSTAFSLFTRFKHIACPMPRLVACARPEQVLHRVEQLATATGSAMLFYRSLLEHDALREVVVLMLDSGDLPAQRLIRYPELLDSLLLPGEDIDTLGRKVAAALDNRGELARDERARQVRRLKQLEEFKIVGEWLASGPEKEVREPFSNDAREKGSRTPFSTSLDTMQEKLSVLAELCVERAARWHAPAAVERDRWAVMALGKLGGIELAVHSDLDLVIF